jgi:hypothetical protein
MAATATAMTAVATQPSTLVHPVITKSPMTPGAAASQIIRNGDHAVDHRAPVQGPARVNRIVRNQGLLSDLMKPADTVALGTGAFRSVRRKGFGIEERLPPRIIAGARIEHAQQVRKRGHTADRESCSR